MGGRAAPHHDRDAGGDPEILAAKAALRERVWSAMSRPGVARFPGAAGRIPNFVGAEAAADRLRETDLWRRATTVKANPDAPQRPVRERVLGDGMTLFMAVPRLADERPFLRLDGSALGGSVREASSIKGAARFGRPVDMEKLQPVDLVVVGCVAVGEDGARLGKGGGFADLELALAAEAGLVGRSTAVVTTVHDLQVLAEGEIPVTDHDVSLDLVVTPTRVVRAKKRGSRPKPRLRWEELTEAKIRAIPVLGRMQTRSG